MAYAHGQRVKITSGTYAGKLATVLAGDAGGRVVVFLDGQVNYAGVRAYVPSSLQPLAAPVPVPVPVPPAPGLPPEPAGWRRIFEDDFNADVPLGQFPSAVAGRWGAYLPTWQGSAKNSFYDAAKVASVHDGVLDLWCHTQDGRRVTAAPYPRLPADPAVAVQSFSGPFTGYYTESMRVAVRAKAEAMPGYKTAWLTWPRSDDVSRWSGGGGTWPGAGEIDFPEGDFKAGAHVMGFMHRQGASTGGDQDFWDAGVQWTDGQWHEFVMEWRMGVSCQLFCDGRAGPKWTSRVPSTPMRYVIQTETELGGIVPGPEVQGHVLIDWITVAVAS